MSCTSREAWRATPSYRRVAVNGLFAFCTVMSGIYRVFTTARWQVCKNWWRYPLCRSCCAPNARLFLHFKPLHMACIPEVLPNSTFLAEQHMQKVEFPPNVLRCLFTLKVRGLTNVQPRSEVPITGRHSQETGPKLRSKITLEGIGASLKMQIEKIDNLMQQ